MDMKLKADYEECHKEHGGVPTEHILNYLIKAWKENPALEEAILHGDRTIEGCFRHVYRAVEKKCSMKSGTQCVCVTEEEVYQMAENYFVDTSIERREKATKEEPKQGVGKEETTACTPPESVSTMTMEDCFTEEEPTEEEAPYEQISLF